MEPSGAPWRVLESTQPDTPEAATSAGPGTLAWPVIAAAAVAAAIAVGAFLVASRPDPVVDVAGATGIEGSLASAAPATEPSPAGGGLVVEVGGAVARPGVYRLPAGARVGDAIAAAGGYAPRVDAAAADLRLNLAAALRDGEEVHVPARGETATGPAGGDAAGDGAGTAGVAGNLIDLNTASPEQLDTLPGVGPATAAKIIAAREEQPFVSVDELRSRKVVGEATLEKIRALVTVGS